MQNSLLLMNQNGRPLDFTARLNMLERAAYYQPLSTVKHNLFLTYEMINWIYQDESIILL